jgi:CheY-like chemotaxis protein
LDKAAYFFAPMPSSSLIVLTGPPLPGRWSLARALERRLGARRFLVDVDSVALFEIMRALSSAGALALVDGDLPSCEARAEVLELGDDACERVLVEWRCTRKEAEREVFHRYASRPRVLGSAELERYFEDSRVREVPAGECGDSVKLVVVGPELTLDEQVERVAAALQAPPPAPITVEDGVRRVMVVEDDADERAVLVDVMSELGFTVEQAPDAGVALALLDLGAEIELLVSDHQMPGMSGVELARVVGERHPGVRTLLLTAYSDEDLCRRAVEASAVTVLAKPLSIIDLERALDEL